MTTYGNAITMRTDFATAVEKVRDALAAQGFGVLTEIDVAATMKAKLGLDMADHVILGACNPPLAHEALSIDPSIGLLLPCNVVVRSLEQGVTLVEALDPTIMVSATGNQALATVATQAAVKLTAALAELSAA